MQFCKCRGVEIFIHTSYDKTNQMYWFLKIYFWKKLYMFRTVPLSIIRTFSLYTQQWYMSYRFADSLQACRVFSKNKFWEISTSGWFYYKNLSRCTVTWTSNSYAYWYAKQKQDWPDVARSLLIVRTGQTLPVLCLLSIMAPYSDDTRSEYLLNRL